MQLEAESIEEFLLCFLRLHQGNVRAGGKDDLSSAERKPFLLPIVSLYCYDSPDLSAGGEIYCTEAAEVAEFTREFVAFFFLFIIICVDY